MILIDPPNQKLRQNFLGINLFDQLQVAAGHILEPYLVVLSRDGDVVATQGQKHLSRDLDDIVGTLGRHFTLGGAGSQRVLPP